MDEEKVKQYLLELMTAFGQMKQIDGNVECPHEHVKELKNKGITYQQHGKMSMPTTVRADFLHRGWQLLMNEEDWREWNKDEVAI